MLTLQDRIQARSLYKSVEDMYSEEGYDVEYGDPYFYMSDYAMKCSPIESRVWHDIRTSGLPFYFEFPVLNYFIDFADPKRKIGIEVDGKEWHRDKEKDNKRQRELEQEGWNIYRFTGKDVYMDLYKDEMYYYNEEYKERFDRFIDTDYYRDMMYLIKSYNTAYT